MHAVNEVAERLAFFAVAVNMVAYLVLEMRQSLPSAATHVTDWIGAAYVLTLVGAFLADAYLGRFKTIIIFSCVYAVVCIVICNTTLILDHWAHKPSWISKVDCLLYRQSPYE